MKKFFVFTTVIAVLLACSQHVQAATKTGDSGLDHYPYRAKETTTTHIGHSFQTTTANRTLPLVIQTVSGSQVNMTDLLLPTLVKLIGGAPPPINGSDKLTYDLHVRLSYSRGDVSESSSSGEAAKNTVTKDTDKKPRGNTRTLADAAHGTNPQMDAAHGTNPQMDAAHGTKPQMDAAHGTKPQMDVAHGANAQMDEPSNNTAFSLRSEKKDKKDTNKKPSGNETGAEDGTSAHMNGANSTAAGNSSLIGSFSSSNASSSAALTSSLPEIRNITASPMKSSAGSSSSFPIMFALPLSLLSALYA
ncbi:hypothetical protein BV898_05081 [Hypsibius exemplaris]|uniref:Uncharacterized protein n=1 Tax=Hypsibius exemplaris TaxID=2072580 RepID=A0A1W0X0N1_HYPEX|nr:hypothetical protein BV898_05081 [Hypsibius exemplaris]